MTLHLSSHTRSSIISGEFHQITTEALADDDYTSPGLSVPASCCTAGWHTRRNTLRVEVLQATFQQNYLEHSVLRMRQKAVQTRDLLVPGCTRSLRSSSTPRHKSRYTHSLIGFDAVHSPLYATLSLRCQSAKATFRQT
jgi:hypothetical protein